MDDHFDICHVFEISKFDIARLTCSVNVMKGNNSYIIRGVIKRREAGIFPFYSGMFPMLLLINLYRVYRQILSNHPPTLP